MSGLKWTFIDGAGDFAINEMYDDVRDFHEGLCAVKKDGLWGYIDRASSWIVPPRYIGGYDFHEGMAVVCTFCRYSKEENKYVRRFGYIDRTGTLVIEGHYHYAGMFRDGMAEVHSYGKCGEHELVEFICKNGTVAHSVYGSDLIFNSQDDIISHKYDFTGSYFHEGYACAEKGGWIGLITVDGFFIPVMKREYDHSQYIGPVRNGLAIIEVWHEEYELLVVKGKKLNVISDSKEMAQMINEAGFVRFNINLLTDEECQNVYMWPNDSDLMRFRSDETHRYGFKDKSGNIVVGPQLFETRCFSEGMCAVQF